LIYFYERNVALCEFYRIIEIAHSSVTKNNSGDDR
jgi:hypothetical protein